MADRIIEWVAVPFAKGWEDEEPDAIEWIDVALFDAAWQQTDQWIGPGGVGGQGHRYAEVGARLLQGLEVEMCTIGLQAGQVGFTDGQHRFAWLRDHGVEAIPVQVDPGVVPECLRRFPTSRRISSVSI